MKSNEPSESKLDGLLRDYFSEEAEKFRAPARLSEGVMAKLRSETDSDVTDGAKPHEGLIQPKVFGIPVYIAPLFWSVALASILVISLFYLHHSDRLTAIMPNLIWWGAIALEAFILERGLRKRLLFRYPLFFSYISCILLTELTRFSCYMLAPRLYQSVYWHSELVISLARYAVLVGIYGQFFRDHPGARRLARLLLLSVAFAVMLSIAGKAFYEGFGSWEFAAVTLSRALPYVEVPLLVVLLLLRHYYRISMGRDIWALTLGYGFFLRTVGIHQGILFLPTTDLSLFLARFLPTTYLVTLMIWSAALWSYQHSPL